MATHTDGPVPHIQVSAPLPKIQRIIRQREQTVLVTHQVQEQGKLQRPNRRSGKNEGARELDRRRKHRVRPHPNVLQVLNEVEELNLDLTLTVVLLPDRHAGHAATPAGTIFVHRNVNVLRATGVGVGGPLRQIMVSRKREATGAGVVEHPPKLGLNLTRDAATQPPLTVPQADQGHL